MHHILPNEIQSVIILLRNKKYDKIGLHKFFRGKYFFQFELIQEIIEYTALCMVSRNIFCSNLMICHLYIYFKVFNKRTVNAFIY